MIIEMTNQTGEQNAYPGSRTLRSQFGTDD